GWVVITGALDANAGAAGSRTAPAVATSAPTTAAAPRPSQRARPAANGYPPPAAGLPAAHTLVRVGAPPPLGHRPSGTFRRGRPRSAHADGQRLGPLAEGLERCAGH